MKASIRLVTLIGVPTLLLFACNQDVERVDELTTTTTTPTTSISTETPLCSADGLVVGAGSPQGDLPGEVAAMRTELLAAASMCDFDQLGAMATAHGTGFTFGGGTDPAAYWRNLEADGETPLADMVQLLNLEPALFDVGEGIVYYVWPAVYALSDWSDATEEQRQELADLFGADQLAGWDSFGGYVGYRVGINVDGSWSFFVAGD